MKNNSKILFSVIATLSLIGSLAFPISKVLAATGGGTATIAVDGGSQSGAVTVVQSTSHTFATVLTINISGMTLGAASPTFTIPTGFTAPTTHAVANSGLVNADGKWSVAASGGGCAVDSSPVSVTTVASGQVITVDITADCAVGNTITLTYQGTSSVAMTATALTVSTADAGDPGPVTALIAGSPTITVTASTPSPTPTPTPSSTSGASGGSSSGGSSSSSSCPSLASNVIAPIIIESRRVSPTSIFVSWGPYSGINLFNIQYGTTNGNWLYNTDVVGFSTTINALPANTPMWVRVGARSSCTIGIYGQSKLVGNPGLPNTGFDPKGYFPVTNMLVLNMTPINFLYYSLAIGFLILVGFVSYAAISISQTLKRLTSILIKVDDIAKDADELKNTIKGGVLGLISMFVKKGGVKE